MKKNILISSLFIFVFLFTLTFSAIAEETTPVVESQPATIKENLAQDKLQPAIKKVIKKIQPTIKKVIKKEIPVIKRQPVDLKCVKAAVEKREIAIQATVDVYSAAIKASFEARKNSLLVAWDIVKVNERNIAIKNAFVQHQKAKRDALKIDKKTRLVAWQNFIKERIVCHAEPTGEDMNVDVNFNE